MTRSSSAWSTVEADGRDRGRGDSRAESSAPDGEYAGDMSELCRPIRPYAR